MLLSGGRNRPLLVVQVLLVGCLWAVVPAAGSEFADSSLAAAVSEAVGQPVESLTEADLAALTQLVARERGIADLAGMGQLVSLQLLDLAGNEIQDLRPLSTLTQLRMLDLEGNRVRDLSPLASLPHLQSLILNDNEISDVSPLLALPALTNVELLGNPLTHGSLTAHIPALEARGVEVLNEGAQPGQPVAPVQGWEHLGPAAEQRQALSVRRLALAPSDPEVMYALTGNGLWRSTNGGAYWAPTTLMGKMQGVFVDAGDVNRVYVASSSGGWGPTEHLRSTDGGTTWECVVGVPGSLLSADAACPRRLYAVRAHFDPETMSGHRDFAVSHDDGDTWQEIGRVPGIPSEQSVHVHAADPAIVYLVAKHGDGLGGQKIGGLFLSVDGGTTWAPHHFGRELWDMWPDARDPEGLWGVDRERLWHSDDGGCSWHARGDAPQKGMDHLIVHPLAPDWIWTWRSGGYNELWQSRDGGESWAPITSSETATVAQVVPHPRSPTRAFRIEGEGAVKRLYATADGGRQWERLDLTMDWPPVLALGFQSDGTLLGASWQAEGQHSIPILLTSQDGGTNWEARELRAQEQAGWFTLLYCHPSASHTVLAYSPLVGYLRSDDGGVTWESLAMAAAHLRAPRTDPEVVAVRGQDGATRYYAVDPESLTLFRCDGLGGVCQELKEDVSGVAAHPGNADVVFAVTWGKGAVWRSRDGGATWTSLGAVAPGTPVVRLGINPLAPSRLYAVTTSAVHVSTDEGTTWSPALLEFELARTKGVKIRFNPHDEDVVYVTTGRELWESWDGGESWRSLVEAEGSPTWINDLAVDPLDPEWLYAATPRGVYRWHSAGKGTAVAEQRDAVPGSFALSPNYPNPFNAQTVIGYTVPAAGLVELEVYNVLGQRVTRLVAEEQGAGAHRVAWDGRDASGRPAATGVYLCRLSAGGEVAVRRMLLLR